MARDPHLPTALQTDPQHRGLFLFKGKPYLWLASHTSPQHRGLFLFKWKPYLWFATYQPIPNLGVKVKMDGA